jgi:ribonuclease III
VDRADRLAARLGLRIRDRELLDQALTHTSWLHEHPGVAAGHNERLEFLGDAVVNLAISEALYARHPDDDEGLLSARRAAIVSATGLARIAGRIELGLELRLGEGEAQRHGRQRPSILAAALEAVAGALLLDLGWEAARSWIVRLAAPEIEAGLAPAALKSPKSRLQEETQRSAGARPTYRLVEAVGPDHEKVFRVEVVVADEVLGSGTGSSRRQAETEAAARAVAVLIARGQAGQPGEAVPRAEPTEAARAGSSPPTGERSAETPA